MVFLFEKYKLAVVGATGVVGRTVLKVLQEKNLPISEYVFLLLLNLLAKLFILWKKLYNKELTENSFDDKFDFAVFSAGGDTSKKYAPIAVSNGCIVVDNSSAFRMDPTVPLVVPEVNADDIKSIMALSLIQIVLQFKQYLY